jgi:hypothetical protein
MLLVVGYLVTITDSIITRNDVVSYVPFSSSGGGIYLLCQLPSYSHGCDVNIDNTTFVNNLILAASYAQYIISSDNKIGSSFGAALLMVMQQLFVISFIPESVV